MLNRNRVTRLTFLFLVVAFPLAVAIAPSSPAKAAPPTAPDVTVGGCTITFTFTAAANATYTLEVYDDGSVIGSPSVAATLGQLVSLSFTATVEPGSGAPGLGFYLTEGGSLVYFSDPNTSLDGCLTACYLADGAYQVKLSKTVQVYYAPDEGSPVSPVTVIPGGKTVTVISGDASWVKILWSCQYLYIKNSGLGINYEQSSKPYPSFASNR